jgi:arginyl-tRNA synthetase
VTNLTAIVEEILRSYRAEALCSHVELRSREDRYSDMRLLFSSREWLDSGDGDRLVEAFQDHPAVESAQRRKSAISLRLRDEFVSDLGLRLERGELDGMDTSDLLQDRHYMLGFVGPNTNKSLHVGHLRNILLGEALASTFEAAGAHVLRESPIGDIGRRVCESIAGFKRFHEGEVPNGMKPDRFVDLCYRDYLRHRDQREQSQIDGENPGDPNNEERVLRGDYADQLMQEWWQGSRPVLQLWQRLRAWALAGHRETLARLGITLDRSDFESNALCVTLGMIEEGLATGLLKRGSDQMVYFRTGRPEFETMVLLREDGFPTEYARLLSLYDQLLADLYPRYTYVEVAGIEWQPSMAVLQELLCKLRPGPQNSAHVRVFHGMLLDDDQKISSSSGEPLLIDDFLDELEANPRILALEDLSGGEIGKGVLADLVARSFFLGAPAIKPLGFSWGRILDENQNPGWTLARAWCRARRGGGVQGGPSSSPPQPAYRLAVVQSQSYCRSLLQATSQLEVTGLMRFVRSFSETYLAASLSPELDRAARAILKKAFRSLGFLACRD